MHTAVYPGTFDPITNGHTDLIRRAATLFKHVIVAVAQDTGKQTVCDVAQRVALGQKALVDLDNVSVKPFSGLLVDYCRQQRAKVVIRGLRAVSDFEYEFQLAGMNRRLHDARRAVCLHFLDVGAGSVPSGRRCVRIRTSGGSASAQGKAVLAGLDSLCF